MAALLPSVFSTSLLSRAGLSGSLHFSFSLCFTLLSLSLCVTLFFALFHGASRYAASLCSFHSLLFAWLCRKGHTANSVKGLGKTRKRGVGCQCQKNDSERDSEKGSWASVSKKKIQCKKNDFSHNVYFDRSLILQTYDTVVKACQSVLGNMDSILAGC